MRNKRQKRPPSALLKVVRSEVFRQRIVADKTTYSRKTRHGKSQEGWAKHFHVA